MHGGWSARLSPSDGTKELSVRSKSPGFRVSVRPTVHVYHRYITGTAAAKGAKVRFSVPVRPPRHPSHPVIRSTA
jgi:hypothetical protein